MKTKAESAKLLNTMKTKAEMAELLERMDNYDLYTLTHPQVDHQAGPMRASGTESGFYYLVKCADGEIYAEQPSTAQWGQAEAVSDLGSLYEKVRDEASRILGDTAEPEPATWFTNGKRYRFSEMLYAKDMGASDLDKWVQQSDGAEFTVTEDMERLFDGVKAGAYWYHPSWCTEVQ